MKASVTDGLPWMDHIDTVLEGDPDDIVLGEVSTNRSETFSNLICLIGLEE